MDDKLDLVSNLPCEILKHIISFLPLKEAVRSSSLSRVWRQVLAPLSLHFDNKEEANEALCTFLSSFICPDRLNISLSLGHNVVFATKGLQKELHLHFVDNNNFTTKLYFSLNLTRSNLRKCCPFSCLKTLYLRSINFHSVSLVSDVFSNYCDVLESFKVEKCIGLENLHVEAAISLRSLTVLDCPDILSIAVSAPSLKSFRYRGVLPHLQLKRASSELVEVTLDLRDGVGHNEFDCEQVVGLLSSLKEAQTLTISAWLLEWMCTAGVLFGWLEFGFMKLKELCWVSSSMSRAKRDSLACFLNVCPILEKLFIEMNESLGSIDCPYFHQHWHEPHLWMDFETVKSNTLQLKHLNMLKWSGFRGQEDEILLINLLLNKAIVLESMILNSDSTVY